MTCIRTSVHEETELLTVLKFKHFPHLHDAIVCGPRQLHASQICFRYSAGVAGLLRKLASAPSCLPPIDVEKAIASCQQKTGKTNRR